MSVSAPDIETADLGEATRDRVFLAAERLFARDGFQAVSVRDITAEAGVNLAAVNYHFGSKDGLLFEIFRHRSAEINRTRARMLHEATDRAGGKPTVRAILEALIAPPVMWMDPAGDRGIAVQFMIRARSEGTEEIKAVLRTDVSALKRFTDALIAARPDLSGEDVYWRMHFILGVIHQNRSAELERLGILSGGTADVSDVAALQARMVDFAVKGFG